MKYRFTPRALRDLDGIIAYLLEDHIKVANRFRHVMLEMIALVCEYPYAGIKNARDVDIRSKTVPGFRYRIHYAVIDDSIVVVHIRHTSRDA